MKKLTTLFLLALLSLTASSQTLIDGVYYKFSSATSYSSAYAYVTSGDTKYTGDIVIPEVVTYNNVVYSVRRIADDAFKDCSDLTSVKIPNSVFNIGGKSFQGCSGLTSVTIPNSVTGIGPSAFMGCSGLTSITIPNSMTGISERTFYDCSGLTSVTIPSSVTSIGSSAFENCTSLTSFTVPNNMVYFGARVFSGCIGLTSPIYSSVSFAYMPKSFKGGFSIPDGIREIAGSAFSYCTGLTSITIPNSVTSIGGYAFDGCSGLTSVVIPNSVTSLGTWPFCDCYGLTSVTIGSGITSIPARTFDSCYELTEVYCYAKNTPYAGRDAFSSAVKKATLYVPEASVSAYQTTYPWSEFGAIKTLSGDTLVIPETPKCATPTISFLDGKLQFSCETEGVEYVYHMDYVPAIDGNGNSFSLPKTMVTVYATKKGYDNSDVATKEINVGGTDASGVRGDVNLDGEVGMPDVMFIVNYILNGKFPDE